MNLAALLGVASCILACPPNDPGTVVVVGGALKPIQFNVPGSVDCRLAYNTSRLALFFDAGATQPAPPNTTFQSPPAVIEHGDMNLDGRVNGADIQKFVEVLLGLDPNPVLIAQADFDENMVLNSNDTALFVNALLSGVTATSTVTLFAQGLSASAALCDTPVDILTDEDMNGTFVLAGTVETTVVALTLTPSSGPVGTPVTATIAPAIAPLTFTGATTAQWSGVFQPMVGSPSATFQIQYGAAQVREQSATQAILIVGDGTLVNAPDFATTRAPGSLVGTLTISFGSNVVGKPFSFAPSPTGQWRKIDYLDDSISTGPPVLGMEPSNLEVMVISIEDDPNAQDEFVLLHAYGFHFAAVVEIEENPTTAASSPATLSVDLVSYDPSDVEFHRLSSVTLTKVTNDGDPTKIVYTSDLAKPIILVDYPLHPMAFPNVYLLRMPAGGEGTAAIVPHIGS